MGNSRKGGCEDMYTRLIKGIVTLARAMAGHCNGDGGGGGTGHCY